MLKTEDILQVRTGVQGFGGGTALGGGADAAAGGAHRGLGAQRAAVVGRGGGAAAAGHKGRRHGAADGAGGVPAGGSCHACICTGEAVPRGTQQPADVNILQPNRTTPAWSYMTSSSHHEIALVQAEAAPAAQRFKEIGDLNDFEKKLLEEVSFASVTTQSAVVGTLAMQDRL